MKVFLAYAAADQDHADRLRERLAGQHDLDVAGYPLDAKPATAPKSFVTTVRNHDAIIQMISISLLQSLGCMRELIPVMNGEPNRNMYLARSVPLTLADTTTGMDLSRSTAQITLANHWATEKRLLQSQLTQLDDEVASAINEVRDDVGLLNDIALNITRFMRLSTQNRYVADFAREEKVGFAGVVKRVQAIVAETPLPDTPKTRRSRTATGREAAARATPPLSGAEASEVQRLTRMLDSIRVPSENDPDNPEFPPFSPRFPATPTKRVFIQQLRREVTIKDESYNFTGTHKDRMAWEIVVYYKELIRERLAPHADRTPLPAASIISNGSAALAIQVMMRCFGLPPLRVLLDSKTHKRIIRKLESVGCEVFTEDLSVQVLGSEEVLERTKNKGGFDITARGLIDPGRRSYYDWLAYEILNCGAKHIFVPVGTGDLLVNILTVLRDELTGVADDARFKGGSESIEGLNVYGATSYDRKTRMNKLFATHRPTLDEAQQVVDKMRDEGLCGSRSKIYGVSEKHLQLALREARAHNIHCDESGIAGLSLLIQLNFRTPIPEDEEILVVNTGWLHLSDI